jgi:hypothetical protein
VQGLTVGPALRWLGIAQPAPARARYEEARGTLLAARAALEELDRTANVYVAAPQVRDILEHEYRARIARAESELQALHRDLGETVPATHELQRARRYLLLTEKNRILDAFRLGAMSEEVRDRLIADLDARWAQMETEAATPPPSMPEAETEADRAAS